MRSFLDIVKARSNPGILILDGKDALVYSNPQALGSFPGLRKGRLPEEVLDLCRGIRKRPEVSSSPHDSMAGLVIDNASGLPFALRAFPIAARRSARTSSFVMAWTTGCAGEEQGIARRRSTLSETG